MPRLEVSCSGLAAKRGRTAALTSTSVRGHDAPTCSWPTRKIAVCRASQYSSCPKDPCARRCSNQYVQRSATAGAYCCMTASAETRVNGARFSAARLSGPLHTLPKQIQYGSLRHALRRPLNFLDRRAGSCTQAIEGDSLVPLGLDCLTFLASTVLVIPLFKSVKASPVLGFLFSGIVLGQLGCATL